MEEFVEELVSKGEVSKKDARQFAGDIVRRGEEQREELKKLIQGEVEKALRQTNLGLERGYRVTRGVKAHCKRRDSQRAPRMGKHERKQTRLMHFPVDARGKSGIGCAFTITSPCLILHARNWMKMMSYKARGIARSSQSLQNMV